MKLSVQVDYLTQDPKSGMWKYRRRVPERLRLAMGKREIVQSLKTKDRSIALERYAVADQAAVAALIKAGAIPRDRLLYDQTMRDLKATGLVKPDAQQVDPIPNDYDSQWNKWTAAILAESGKLPQSVQNGPLRRDNNPALRMLLAQFNGVEPPRHSLSEAVDHYVKAKADGSNDRDLTKQVGLVVAVVRELTGKDDPTLEEITRDVAEQFRDTMLARGNKPATVKRRINTIRALVTLFITDKRLGKQLDNPFTGLKVKESAVSLAKKERDALTIEDIAACVPRFAESNTDMTDIWTMQIFTGCRPTEISGLSWSEVHLDDDTPHLRLTFTPRRRLKNKGSVRRVPLVGAALRIVRARAEGQHDSSDPVFPRYGGSGGPAALSALQIKKMKQAGVWQVGLKVPYSTRHSVSDWMQRWVSLAEAERLMGHGSGKISTNYGSDHMLDLLASHLTKALTKAGVWDYPEVILRGDAVKMVEDGATGDIPTSA